MAKEEILGALRLAHMRSENLNDVIRSFYNAGYTKEDLDEAANIFKQELLQDTPSTSTQQVNQTQPQTLQTQQNSPPPISQTQNSYSNRPTYLDVEEEKYIPAMLSQQSSPQQAQTSQSYSAPVSQTSNTIQNSQVKQVVSIYDDPKKKRVDFITILLVILLLFLVGILISVFVFKDSLIQFLNNFLD